MKRIALALTLTATALVITACTETATPTNTSTPSVAASPAPSAPATPVDELAAARANYSRNCEACHGPTGVGGLVKVEDKQIKVASLKTPSAIKHTDEQLAKTIANGEEAMPAFKDKMAPAEITDMVKFIRKEFQGR
jgi:mono/diheme cytochrome c family protein